MLAEIYPQRLGAGLVGVEPPEEAFAQPGPCQSDDRVTGKSPLLALGKNGVHRCFLASLAS